MRPRSLTLVSLLVAAAAHSAVGQEPPLVEPGSDTLDLAVVTPHRAVWTLHRVQGDAEQPLGTFERVTSFVDHTRDEPAVFVRWEVALPGRAALDLYYLHRSTLGQIARYQTGANGIWAIYFSGDVVRGTYTRRDREPLVFEVPVERQLFNTAMADMVMATLPLVEGYRARLPVITTSASSLEAGVQATLNLHVTGRETVMAAGRSWDAWVVESDRDGAMPQRVWVVKEAPYLVRRDALSGTGEVTARWRLDATER